MRKILSIILAITVIFGIGSTVIAEKEITVTVNGKNIQFDQPPIIQDGRTLVPLRAIFEALGADVAWSSKANKITATRDSTTIELYINKKDFRKNNKSLTMDVPPQIINERTLVPARAIAESMDCTVDWDGTKRQVIIKSDYIKSQINFIGSDIVDDEYVISFNVKLNDEFAYVVGNLDCELLSDSNISLYKNSYQINKETYGNYKYLTIKIPTKDINNKKSIKGKISLSFDLGDKILTKSFDVSNLPCTDESIIKYVNTIENIKDEVTRYGESYSDSGFTILANSTYDMVYGLCVVNEDFDIIPTTNNKCGLLMILDDSNNSHTEVQTYITILFDNYSPNFDVNIRKEYEIYSNGKFYTGTDEAIASNISNKMYMKSKKISFNIKSEDNIPLFKNSDYENDVKLAILSLTTELSKRGLGSIKDLGF